MAITPVPALTDIPQFPALSDRAAGTYNSKAFAFGTHMSDKFNEELGAVASSVMQNATLAEAKADSAATSAGMAASALEAAEYTTGVAGWVSGKTYQKFEAAISQINAQVYRRTAAGSGAIDPANDASGVWVMRAGNGAFVPLAAPTTTFDLSRSSYFKRAMTGNETWVFDKCPADGYRFFVELDLQAGVLSLPSSVKTSDDIVYPMSLGKVQLLMFVTSNRGARWRMVAAPNFTA